MLVDRLPVPSQNEGGSGLFDADDFVGIFDDWVREQGIRLYPAQEEAVLELVLGKHLVLSTPTGTGKSLVALAAHAIALAQGRRSWYTAPIKALVSEKFFQLVEAFGAENVGLVTGDSSVNADAPIVCCTAEILANLALRRGTETPADVVVMDEFHYYSDPERGWAWQVPLLLLPRAQFLLMSATLGDVTVIAEDLERRTGRDLAQVTGVERPVPLDYRYVNTPVHETVEQLLTDGLAPVYIVHFSQAAAVERAQALSSTRIASREQRDAIADELGGFRFAAGFGATLSRLIRAGVGVHHAGMLPKYRRLVEQLAQRGLLRVICGTDTLGVGINVPIRTVLFTALSKYDGSKTRLLQAREFHQIAGRAGRAGFDVTGRGVVPVILSIGIFTWAVPARLLRSSILSVRESEYVEAARSIGASRWRIVTRHILPNSLAPVLVYGMVSVGTAIVAETALSFLGVGVKPELADWGNMISAGRGYFGFKDYLWEIPSLAVVFTVLGFVFVGDGLRDALDPRLR